MNVVKSPIEILETYGELVKRPDGTYTVGQMRRWKLNTITGNWTFSTNTLMELYHSVSVNMKVMADAIENEKL